MRRAPHRRFRRTVGGKVTVRQQESPASRPGSLSDFSWGTRATRFAVLRAPARKDTSAAMPAAPVAAGVTVLPPVLVPAAPAVAPRTPLVGIPALSPPEADAGRDINANGRSRRFAPVASSRAAPVGACRQSKSDAERQDNCREKRFHAGANADRERGIPLRARKKPLRRRRAFYPAARRPWLASISSATISTPDPIFR